MVGFIQIDRKILKWEWYQDSNMVHLFLHLLLQASHKETSWQGISINRGQVVTGRLKLATAVGLTQRQIRTCLEKLKSTNEIAITTTNKYSIITICKYDTYQKKKSSSDQQNDQQKVSQATNKPPTSDQQATTYNKDNNSNNYNNVNKIIPHFSENFEFVFFADGSKQKLGEEQKILAETNCISPLTIIKGSIY